MLSHSLDNHLVPKISPLPSMQVDRDMVVVLLETPGGTAPSILNILKSVVRPEGEEDETPVFHENLEFLNCKSLLYITVLIFSIKYSIQLCYKWKVRNPVLLSTITPMVGSTGMFFCFSFIADITANHPFCTENTYNMAAEPE